MKYKINYLLKVSWITICFICSVLASADASETNSQGDTPFVFQKDFSSVKSGLELERGTLLSTSLSAKLFQLKNDKSGYVAGSYWIVKNNELHDLVHEYIASKIYQFILGDDLISDVVWVNDKHNPNKHYVAIQYDAGLLHFVKEAASEHRLISNRFPFSCVLNGCQANHLLNESSKDYEMLKTKNPYSSLDKMRIKGGELAILASILINDQDIAWGQNFALKNQGDHWAVTRIDFDASLNFFNSFKVSPGMTPQALVKMYGQSHGLTLERAKELAVLMNDQLNQYFDVSFVTFADQFPNIAALQNIHTLTQQSKAMQKAMQVIKRLDMQQIDAIVTQAIQDIQPYISNQLLDEYYNFGFWRKLFSQSKWDLIKAFILEKIGERQAQIVHIYDTVAHTHEEL